MFDFMYDWVTYMFGLHNLLDFMYDWFTQLIEIHICLN
jgi:hypothetical protein